MKSISAGLATYSFMAGFTVSSFMWPINSAIEHRGSVGFTQVFSIAFLADISNQSLNQHINVIHLEVWILPLSFGASPALLFEASHFNGSLIPGCVQVEMKHHLHSFRPPAFSTKRTLEPTNEIDQFSAL